MPEINRRGMLFVGLGCALSNVLLLAPRCLAEDGLWKAGAAKTVITPAGRMWMAGYASRKHPAFGTSSDLYCKALYLEDPEGNAGLVITLDLVGIARSLSQEWCQAIGRRWGIRRDQILINVSHTHSGPVIGENLPALHRYILVPEERERVDRYTKTLTKKVLDTVARAKAKTVPVRLAWGSGRATFAVNRRENRPESKVPAWRKEGKLKGPTDHDVPVLAVWRIVPGESEARSKDRPARHELLAVCFGYACHATVLSWYYWSGDYPGHAQARLEERYPGCVALFWAGCGGDQNPLPRSRIELAQRYGMALADAVSTVLDGAMHPIRGSLRTGYREVDLAFAHVPARDQIEKDLTSRQPYVVARARLWRDRLARGESLPARYPYPIGYWQLGDDVEWFSLGGEVVVDYAIRLKTARRGKRTWVAGYSHDVMAYIPSLRVLREGGYEGGGAMVYYGFFAPWREDVERRIVETATALAAETAKASGTSPDRP